MAKIFSVGMRRQHQAAMRADGQWFIRARVGSTNWGKWEKCSERPPGTWYNPNRNKKEAVLPED